MGEQKTALTLLLILCVILIVIPKVSIVKADETIYIRADGNVDPLTERIQRNGDIYIVISDFDHLVVLERNNTVFDGAGYTIEESMDQINRKYKT